MPYNYRQLDNHAKATPKSGTVTAPGLYKSGSVGIKQDKNHSVRPHAEKNGK